MNMQVRFLVVLFLGLFFYAVPVWAGWVVTYSDAESGAQSKEYYQDGKANLGSLIHTGKYFLVVDQDSRAYWKGTPDQYCEVMRAQLQKMKEQMASVPAQYRPVPISQKKVTRKKLGKKSIAGYSATGYEFYVDGNQRGQVWVSSDSGLSDVINFGRSMVKNTECLEGMDSASLDSAALYEKTVRNAFTLKESYRQVVSIDRENVSSDKFQSPDGYASYNDFQKYMDHLNNQSRSSSSSSNRTSPPPSYQEESIPQESPQMDEVAEVEDVREEESSPKRGDNVVVKDTKDIARDSAKEAHQSTKRGIQKEISKDIQKGVGSFLKKIF